MKSGECGPTLASYTKDTNKGSVRNTPLVLFGGNNMNNKLKKLVEHGREVIQFRRNTANDVSLSEDFLSGFEEGVAETIAALTGESVADVLELITKDTNTDTNETYIEPQRIQFEVTGDIVQTIQPYEVGVDILELLKNGMAVTTLRKGGEVLKLPDLKPIGRVLEVEVGDYSEYQNYCSPET